MDKRCVGRHIAAVIGPAIPLEVSLMPSLRALAGAIVAVLVLATDTMAQEASRLQQILESGVLRVGTTGDFNPMSFRNPSTGELEGYDIDAVEKLAADMGVSIEYVPTEWRTLVAGIVADKYDITTSASLSMDRAAVAGFSDPYVEFSTVPMTQTARLGEFGSWEDLDREDVTIAVTLGTVFEQQARSYFQNAEIRTVEAPAREWQEVIAGRATASITSNVDAAQLTTTYPELAVIKVDEPRSRRPGAFLMPQADQVWINYVNHWIALNHASGWFAEQQATWNLAN
jgi:cyclohexadienyl dehydratase